MSEGIQKALSSPFGAVYSGFELPFMLSTPLFPQENFLFWVRLWVKLHAGNLKTASLYLKKKRQSNDEDEDELIP